jgi:hypothetical protein
MVKEYLSSLLAILQQYCDLLGVESLDSHKHMTSVIDLLDS